MLVSDDNAGTTLRVADSARTDLDAALGDLAHAMLNALNNITTASELAKLLLAREPEEAAKCLARIEPECLRAARVLRDGRAFMAFAIRPSLGVVDLVALTDACAESFDGRVKVDAHAALPAVFGDAHALRRAWMEILVNAFQFGANRVDVMLRRVDDDQAAVRIDFRDDGPGITASAARLFDPFFSTRPDEHSGLGLALAARIVVMHGGSIGADAAERGAAFWIKLPVRGE